MPSPSEWCSSCAVRAFEMSASSSGDSGCDAGSSSARIEAGSRLVRLDLVGDSNVARGSGGCCCGGGSGGVVDSTGIEDVGDVLRLLGADDSITGQRCWTSDHHGHYIRSLTRLGGCDACQWEVSQAVEGSRRVFSGASYGNSPTRLLFTLVHNLRSSGQQISQGALVVWHAWS